MAYLIFIRYCARATDSAFPVIVIVRSMFVLLPLTLLGSRSSQLDILIIAPLSCLKNVFINLDFLGDWTFYKIQKIKTSTFEIESYLISAIFEPPFPMIQPISSFGTVISWVCWVVCGLPCWWWPANAANAENKWNGLELM